MPEEETREQIEELINNVEEPVKEAVCETIIEEIQEEEIKPKAKPKSKSRAKPNIKIVKESIEPVEPIVETVATIVVEKPEPPKKVYKLKEIAKCPDCSQEMTQHTLKHFHERRGLCKADIKAAPEPEARGSCAPPPEPVVQQKPKITKDIVNDYIKQNPDTVSNYLRNERAMKAQRKQMNARSLFYFILLYIIKDAV